jgi:hypothetical protein
LARLLRPYEPSAVEVKKKKLEETQGRPNHRGGLLYIIGFEQRRVGQIVGVS